MWCLKLCIVMLCFLYARASANQLPSEQFPSYLSRIKTPEELGTYLQTQLARNESRFLSRRCFQHLVQYAKGLLGVKLWAIKMFDSSAKFPSGFFQGHGGSLGTFDECINTESRNEKVGIIRGKYCLGQLRLVSFKPKSLYENDASERLFQEPEQRVIDIVEKSVGFPWGVCLPDACSAKDYRFVPFLFFLSFSEDECQTKGSQDKELDNADIGAIAFFAVIASLMVISTVYDIYGYYSEKDRGSVLLRSFSIMTNGSKIVTIRENNKEISCLHGIRSINLLLLTAGYQYGVHLFAPLNNWKDMTMWIFNNGAFLEAVVIIDTFFVISGMLISYNYMKYKAEGVRFNVFTYYLNRILRLTPALGAIVLVQTTLLRHLGSGPVWPRTRDPLLVNNCRKYWWSSLLYVQNYVNPNFTKICILPTWQLSVEMQLFILSPLILIPLTKAPKYTLGVVGSLLFGAVLSPFLTAWVYKLKSVIITFRSLEDIRGYIQYFFFPTHTRAAPWLIGFILGYIIFETKKTKLRVPIRKEFLVLIASFLWVASVVVIVMCVAIGSEIKEHEYNWVTHAFHMAFVRPVWSIAISWIIFACVHGYGGPINTILSIPTFQIISRLSYSTYLVNFTLMFALTYQTRTGLNFSDLNSLYKFCGDVILCLAFGFLWNLAFESPFINIANVMFGKAEKKKMKV